MNVGDASCLQSTTSPLGGLGGVKPASCDQVKPQSVCNHG